MGKLNIFAIVFENPAGVYYAGTMIQGHVIVDLENTIKLKGIFLNIEGKAEVHWSENGADASKTENTENTDAAHFRGNEQYIDQDIMLHGFWSSNSNNNTELLRGFHTFPFQFHLPPDLPSSFEGEHGHVRYVVCCTIDKPLEEKTKRPFTVINSLDLNSQLSYGMQLQATNDRGYCCLCCKSGPISATFHLEKQGYVPGETIRPKAEIRNTSNKTIIQSHVDLKMVVSYNSTQPIGTKQEKKQIARISRPSIAAYSEDVWASEKLIVPALPPSYLSGCSIIDIHYIVQLSVDLPCPSVGLRIPLEIVIGTSPLTMAQQFAPVGFTLSALCPSILPALMPSMPLPTYRESIMGGVDIRDEDDEFTSGELFYTPMYTYFNLSRMPSAMRAQSLRD